MKKLGVGVFCLCLVLVTTAIPLFSSGETQNEFVKYDLPFDVKLSVSLVFNNKFQLPLHNSWRPILQPFLKHLDIVSFSVYEDADEPDYLYAEMTVRDFQYSEIRSCYAIHWTYQGRNYYAGTNTHTLGDAVAPIAGYFDASNTAHDFPVMGEINEETNTLTWIIPKDIIGNPEAGDSLLDVHANSYLIYPKDCWAPIQLNLAKDSLDPLVGTYSLLY